MFLIWTTVIITCIGGSSYACNTADECTSDCYVKMATAGCQDKLTTMADALQAQDFDRYCSTAESYKACTETAFAQCDQSLNKTDFLNMGGDTYQQLCQGSPVDKCRMKVAVCSQLMPSGPSATDTTQMCSAMKSYLDCVQENMKSCDSSVTQSQMIGPAQSSYDMQCNAGGAGPCPGLFTCFTSMMPSNASSSTSGQDQQGSSVPTAVDIIKQCGAMTSVLNCLDSKLSSCNLASPRSYSFGDVAKLYTSGCKVFSSNSDVLTCTQFTKCMETLELPSDPAELGKMTSDPQLFCSMMKSVSQCGAAASGCKSDRSDFASLQKSVNTVCPEAKSLVTVDNDGPAIAPRWMTVLVGLVLFLTGHLRLIDV